MIITCTPPFANDYPSSFHWRGNTYEIIEIVGEWRTLGRWWEGDGERRHVHVITTCGRAFELYYDARMRRWALAKDDI